MKLFLDTADVNAIKELNEILDIDGVTTNPSIIAKTKLDPQKVIQDILNILSEDQLLFVQVIANDVEGMIKEAKYINGLGKNVYVKIPATTNGLKAIKLAHNLGLRVLATAIYSPTQALLAAKNGANCLAPYVNRMCNYGDGINEVIDLQKMLDNYHFDSYILAASFKNVNQVYALWKAGIEAVTIPVDVAYNLFKSPLVDNAVTDFEKAWSDTYQRHTLI